MPEGRVSWVGLGWGGESVGVEGDGGGGGLGGDLDGK